MGLAENIAKLRKERNLTQDELGKLTQIGGRQISKYEHNKVVPNIESLKKLSNVFGVTVDFLIADTPNELDAQPNIKDKELLEYFQIIDEMDPKERSIIKLLLELFVKKNQKSIGLQSHD